ILSLERTAAAQMKQKGIELKEADREFHFSYLCRLYERETGVPGRVMLRNELEKVGKTPEQFLASRLFKYDASITMLAKAPIRQQQLKDEFAAHPERYKRSENLVAHILIRVLDPEGRPYTNNWKSPGHEAVNAYVAKMREQQFTATKPKIEALVAAAKQDWEATVKRASEDPISAKVGGLIGRIGPATVVFPPCDASVRDAAVKLKPGEMSEPIRSDFGWHLLKCLEKQDVTFDEAAESVYLNLIQQGRKKIDAELRGAMKVEDKVD
ncbi:MAG TPA: peptidylprolyl isomerase, partial [Planctomycetota bacterium]|nr:peptidylprolyl isomerase [Planctomycetota bacterium]